MKPLVALVVLLALLAALFFGAKAWRQPPPGAVPPVSQWTGEAAASKGGTEARKTPGQEPTEATGTGTGPTTGETPVTGAAQPSPREERKARSIRRMQTIAARWLDQLSAASAMPESQAAEIREIVNGFIADYEALRWRRDVEEDVETAVEKLYTRAEGQILAKLGAGQKDAFRGLPRDWGFGKLDPGPLPEK